MDRQFPRYDSAAFPSRAIPLYWRTLVELPASYRARFGTRFSFPIWGKAWHPNRRQSARLAEGAARLRLVRYARAEALREDDIAGYGFGPEESFHDACAGRLRAAPHDVGLVKTTVPLLSRFRFLFPRDECGLEFFQALMASGTLGALCLCRLSNGGLLYGAGCDRDAGRAFEKAALDAADQLHYLRLMRSGREQLMPGLEWQRLWWLANDPAVASEWRETLTQARAGAFCIEVTGRWNDDAVFETKLAGPEPTLLGHRSSWEVLWRYHGGRIKTWASRRHAHGLKQLQLSTRRVPKISELRSITHRETGWELVPVVGELPAQDFFPLLARRKFPLSKNLRPLDQVFATSDPDLWHETLGHLPFLWDKEVAALYETLGRKVSGGERADLLKKAYWYTGEYGLIREGRDTKILGAGLLASPLGPDKLIDRTSEVRPFNWNTIASAPANPYTFQGLLFEIEDPRTIVLEA